MSAKDTPAQIRLDERQHVEKPLFDQLAGLGWEILDLDAKQHPGDSHRTNFTEVVMLSVLREQLKVINPWLEDDQVDEVIKQLTANFPSTNLLQNNRHVFNQLLENTSVSENRKTGEKSPSVKFIDFKNRDNNCFITVCQFKVRIPARNKLVADLQKAILQPVNEVSVHGFTNFLINVKPCTLTLLMTLSTPLMSVIWEPRDVSRAR